MVEKTANPGRGWGKLAAMRAILLICAFSALAAAEVATAVTFHADNAGLFNGKRNRGELPPDIRLLHDNSIVKRKIVKIYDIVPKSILNRAAGSYGQRRDYLNSPAGKKDFKDLEYKITKTSTRNRLAKDDPALAAAEVLETARQIVVCGRPLVWGSCEPKPAFDTLAKYYGFEEVCEFLRRNNALDTKRNDANGMREDWPADDAPGKEEFRDFAALAQVVNAGEWGELRAKWKEQHAKFKSLAESRARGGARKGKRRR